MTLALDAATPGRMAITFYRELTGSEFLARVLDWHESHAWHQRYCRQIQFSGTASPTDIAEAAYGPRLNDKLRKATVERLLPCILDGRPIPSDIVDSCVRKANNRTGPSSWDWEKCLGIACGLYRGYRRKENYKMSLEEDRTSRDYLYGRLLAIGEHKIGRAHV